MKLAIIKVILWPKNQTKTPRIIEFATDRINVITGQSASGKSSISWIIDYCLGSNKCSIPVGMIRDLSEWFGLHIQLRNLEMIIARRNPGDRKSTSDLYWEEGVDLMPPEHPEKNARVEDFKNRMNQIARLPTLDFSDADGNPGYASRPSFRDMAAFNFQPQHIVANPFTLFYKADTTEHRETLTHIFPLVLGAVDAGTLADERELRDLERQYARVRREHEKRTRAVDAWSAEVQSFYFQAKEVGLLMGSPEPEDGWRLERYLVELRKVPDNLKELNLPDVPEGATENAVEVLRRTIATDEEHTRRIGDLRRRLAQLDVLADSVGEFRSELAQQEDRLSGTNWLKKKLAEDCQCPVCGNSNARALDELAQLEDLADEVAKLSRSAAVAPSNLDKEKAEIREELRTLESNLRVVRKKRAELEGQTEQIVKQRQRVRNVYLFAGRVQEALNNIDAAEDGGDKVRELARLNELISVLKRKLDPGVRKRRLMSALESVSRGIESYAKLLMLEHQDENPTLDAKELTLKFQSKSGRTDYLWEVGSGQNWVGYHIATFLALHEYFLKLANNPVPTFLVIDQPSQVYFPEEWPALDEAPKGKGELQLSEDIKGVRRIFLALDQMLTNTDNELQIIVTEHAGSLVWESCKNVLLIGNWRDGEDEFLIPEEWRV
ncbi:AYP/GTP-binding protein [Haloferula helveola]|uniref:AYP/GTP-binding protein n=1 Tax=Haloferula helveola TaxID=490095 RepID=A0ABM7RFS0_9BACT|nr:AYP/GTP-binding protein [Haloferula helveola]